MWIREMRTRLLCYCNVIMAQVATHTSHTLLQNVKLHGDKCSRYMFDLRGENVVESFVLRRLGTSVHLGNGPSAFLSQWARESSPTVFLHQDLRVQMWNHQIKSICSSFHRSTVSYWNHATVIVTHLNSWFSGSTMRDLSWSIPNSPRFIYSFIHWSWFLHKLSNQLYHLVFNLKYFANLNFNHIVFLTTNILLPFQNWTIKYKLRIIMPVLTVKCFVKVTLKGRSIWLI